MKGALREYGAAEKLVPANAEMIYCMQSALVNMDVLTIIASVSSRLAMDPNWRTLTPRLPKSGFCRTIRRSLIGSLRGRR